MIRVSIAMVVLGLLDLIYQKWKYRHDLRMTRQEVKEEFKQHEVSPRVKGRIRTLQFEMARRRMLKDVPLADVIVVNPDHVAVAIKYETGKMRAPLVVAKGVDFLAEKIKEIALANNVPIMHRPRLAWTLYETVDIGEPVPEKLFVAIAEVLAMIYRLRARRRGVKV